MPQVLDPSVRFPMYKKWPNMAMAAFMPRPNSWSWPTTWKFSDVPGVPPPGPTVTPPGCPVTPARADTLLIGMGERYDVQVTLGDGVFPLTSLAEGKNATALALVWTGSGEPPPATPG